MVVDAYYFPQEATQPPTYATYEPAAYEMETGYLNDWLVPTGMTIPTVRLP